MNETLRRTLLSELALSPSDEFTMSFCLDEPRNKLRDELRNMCADGLAEYEDVEDGELRVDGSPSALRVYRITPAGRAEHMSA